MAKAPTNVQGCYDLGYWHPSTPARDYTFQHLVLVNAYRCGQMDAQNQAPRNREFDARQYDPETFERDMNQ